MLKYTPQFDPKTGKEWIETTLQGKELLFTPLLNKGTAFTVEERGSLGLLGKLPICVETLEEQVQRAQLQFERFSEPLQKYIYLNNIHDKNEILFYKILSENLKSILPMIYTPGVGSAVKEYSHEFRQPRGLYLSYPDKDNIKQMLVNRTNPDIDILVVTDGEAVLGIGDQGIGSIAIPIAKLVIYSLCGLNPYRTLPVVLDVGTDNEALIHDPMYLGWRHKRLRGAEYDDFVQRFMEAVSDVLSNTMLHCEDFGRLNARRILTKYREDLCVFNDDMQGTGVVTLAALLAAMDATNTPLSEQRVVIFGAGSAGVGIADQLVAAMVRQGSTLNDARKRFWFLSKPGLLLDEMDDLAPDQRVYARNRSELLGWSKKDNLDLLNVVKNVKPTILLGCSTKGGAFTKAVVKEMVTHVPCPIIFPLSNPNENAEATPSDLIKWTKGKALIATGSPFPNVKFEDKSIQITQCNNALAFPGIGLGVVATKAKQVTDDMLWAATQAISQKAPIRENLEAPLLPNIEDIQKLSAYVGFSVAQKAIQEEVATKIPKNLSVQYIEKMQWQPVYRPIRTVKKD